MVLSRQFLISCAFACSLFIVGVAFFAIQSRVVRADAPPSTCTYVGSGPGEGYWSCPQGGGEGGGYGDAGGCGCDGNGQGGCDGL